MKTLILSCAFGMLLAVSEGCGSESVPPCTDAVGHFYDMGCVLANEEGEEATMPHNSGRDYIVSVLPRPADSQEA